MSYFEFNSFGGSGIAQCFKNFNNLYMGKAGKVNDNSVQKCSSTCWGGKFEIKDLLS